MGFQVLPIRPQWYGIVQQGQPTAEHAGSGYDLGLVLLDQVEYAVVAAVFQSATKVSVFQADGYQPKIIFFNTLKE